MGNENINILCVTMFYVALPVESIMVECEADISDFKTMRKEEVFVDKTMLIRDLFDPPAIKVVTAPHRSGKSTILDMIRRFLQINVDDIGQRITDLQDTYSCRLFCHPKRRTAICQDRKFFRKHFGKYPVIYVDYKYINDADSYKDIVARFRQILVYTFVQHRYLVNARDLWPHVNVMTVKQFQDISDPDKKLDEMVVRTALKRLSYILFMHYGTPAYVLIDEYDCHLESILFSDLSKQDAMIEFVQSINYDLLKSNPYVERAFITGVMRVTTGWGMADPLSLAHIYAYSRNHKFNKYYGITLDEIDLLLEKLIKDDNNRTAMRNNVVKYFDGYSVMGQDIKLYSIYSTLEYVKSKELRTYWMRPEYLEARLHILYIQEVAEWTIDLLQGRPVCIDISTPFTKHKIKLLSDLHGVCYPPKEIPNTAAMRAYFYLLFELGFLTVNDKNETDEHMVLARIPNLETEYEFARLILDSYYVTYCRISGDEIVRFNQHLRLISNTANDTVINMAFESLHKIFFDSNYIPQSVHDFRRAVFVILRNGFFHVHTEPYDRATYGIGPTGILLENDHNVSIFIEPTVTNKREKEVRDKFARQAISRIMNRTLHLGRTNVLYVGLCFSKEEHLISTTYAKLFKQGDSLDEITLISPPKRKFKYPSVGSSSITESNSSDSTKGDETPSYSVESSRAEIPL